MLTPERRALILQVLQENRSATIPEFEEATGASPSTIRRDLIDMEKDQLLDRVHGGAVLKATAGFELSYTEKQTKNQSDKQAIAAYAASLIGENESIFLDAGTTTYEIIPYLKGKHITVVTNGLTHLDALNELGLAVYVTGGLVKYKTRTLIGRGALTALDSYRFDKCFLGTNGIHPDAGFTTPDPEEAAVKRKAMLQSGETFILGDRSKFGEVAFSHISSVSEAAIITASISSKQQTVYRNLTSLKVVEK